MIYIDSNDHCFDNVSGTYLQGSMDNEHFTSSDILFLDIDQFTTIEEIVKYYNMLPKVLKTVAFTNNPKLNEGAYLIKQGFKSYLSKKSEPLIIREALLSIAAGKVWIYPELLDFIIQKIDLPQTYDNHTSLESLTKKERDVAEFIAKGYSNKEIALQLDVQLVTVKKHLSNIFTKLEVKDRLALAMYVKASI